MPLAPLDDKGTHLWYEDSGIPWACPRYTTLVLIHGGVFHGAIFKPLVPYALQRGIRLVMLNLRDYPGSTPYSWSELTALGSASLDKQRSVLRQRGLEIAAFLCWYIQNENVPMAPSPHEYHSGGGGGVALLAWSWGTAIAMSFLSQSATLPQQDRWRLGSYLRSLILLDSSSHALGVPRKVVSGFYHPLFDARISDRDKGRAFERWVTAHYAHRIPEGVAFPEATVDEVRARLVHYPSTDSSPEHLSSAERMLYHEHDKVVEPEVAERSQLSYMGMDEAVYREVLQTAMWDASAWQRLRITLVWCDKSVAEAVLAACHFAQQVQQWPKDARKVEFVRFRGANHMPHWNEPERTMDLISKLIY
ncbi:alpha/beta-hydrolase [Daedalea quercina L-15889]|uniref:Alpha/beta-hydrolase n=1 Tax=Daedalea quercina L-15889 TaxID=1314783 RepID=A0A165M1P9_9APHY|nr:alpha/beta-hydrolase [Daedalea quercina L-15889]